MSINTGELKIVRTNSYQHRPFEGRGIGLGVFDGFHLGHRELAGLLVAESLKRGLIPGILTFSDHPAYRTGKGQKISLGLLTDSSEKEELFTAAGVQEIIWQDFTDDFAGMRASDFLQLYLADQLQARLIVVGYNYRFGKNREGDVDAIRDWAKNKDVEVLVVGAVRYSDKSISSSWIREAIGNRNIEIANAMLGRKFVLAGKVESGQKLGRKLGFPTANFKPEIGVCLPGNGVYVTRTLVENKYYDSLTNIGIRPTVPGVLPEPIVETLILDREMNLYGKTISVFFLKNLRPEIKFNGLAELIEQIRRDEEQARDYHKNLQEMLPLATVGSVEIYGARCTRFSSDYLEICFKMPLTAENAACYTLLSRIMVAACSQYPSRPALASHLDDLYGASLDSSTDTQGDILSVSFEADALRAFGMNEKPFEQVADLLFDILAEPACADHRFSNELIESERKALVSEIEGMENDKHHYAYEKSIEIFTQSGIYGIPHYGSKDAIESITSGDLYEAYHRLMTQAQIRIFLAGNITREITEDICRKTQKVLGGNLPLICITPGVCPGIFYPDAKLYAVTEEKDIVQTKVCMIYSFPVAYHLRSILAFTVYNMMLGGDVHSLLFQKVREEKGLAYQVYSTPLRHLSGILLMAGIAGSNADAVVKEMAEQVRLIGEGEYETDLFDNSVKSLRTIYRGIPDSLPSVMRFYINQWITGVHITPADQLKFLEGLTKEDVTAIAAQACLKVVYRLQEKKAEQ